VLFICCYDVDRDIALCMRHCRSPVVSVVNEESVVKLVDQHINREDLRLDEAKSVTRDAFSISDRSVSYHRLAFLVSTECGAALSNVKFLESDDFRLTSWSKLTLCTHGELRSSTSLSWCCMLCWCSSIKQYGECEAFLDLPESIQLIKPLPYPFISHIVPLILLGESTSSDDITLSYRIIMCH
jgi:hypothetical protein